MCLHCGLSLYGGARNPWKLCNTPQLDCVVGLQREGKRMAVSRERFHTDNLVDKTQWGRKKVEFRLIASLGEKVRDQHLFNNRRSEHHCLFQRKLPRECKFRQDKETKIFFQKVDIIDFMIKRGLGPLGYTPGRCDNAEPPPR